MNGNSALLTDLYQLTMLQGYFHERMYAPATFELFVRKLPPHRNFLVAAGLEQLLDFLEGFCFSDDECDWLASCGRFDSEFINYLRSLRFTGEIDAMPEGTLFFPDEPILRVTAPLPEAQIIETRVINLLQFQSMIASKAVRSMLAAPDRLLVDFGLRRAHGAEAGLLAARAAYIAGFGGSSNVLACRAFGIPMSGTMAHSFVMAHDDEGMAFEHFARSQPDNIVLLVDTYDTEKGASEVVRLAPKLEMEGIAIEAVRLDSGDLGALAFRVREILDAGGLQSTRIFASGDLDEYVLANLVKDGAPIDGFGIGTRMITSADHPYLNCAYKLEEYAGIPRRKYSDGKATWPGRKQVYRRRGADSRMLHDILTLEQDRQKGEALLIPVMRNGQRTEPAESLEQIRTRLKMQLQWLPPEYCKLKQAKTPYRVAISEVLQNLATTMKEAHYHNEA
ncbi:nicotinate phosphoribosyltransferase [Methylomarinum vadi]|uniref:nicotinate phosphoribosyltransferase n=1 Tax=Methylomarinum vadi TaxID=438855 RepID=UPI0004DF8E1B|nr:nicotinate phosphoribosyltransferase [Methylomarinum vadi]